MAWYATGRFDCSPRGPARLAVHQHLAVAVSASILAPCRDGVEVEPAVVGPVPEQPERVVAPVLAHRPVEIDEHRRHLLVAQRRHATRLRGGLREHRFPALIRTT